MRTDTTKLIVAIPNFANAAKNFPTTIQVSPKYKTQWHTSMVYITSLVSYNI
jgi:hypothetical protein